MKHRIMFVDDEDLVLQGLKRTLRPMGEEWDMEFVNDGTAALKRMVESPFDAVVSDLRMPGMNGAEFLNEVMKAFPQTVRFVLSGHADEDLILKCVGITHQFISKPCQPEELKAAINRSFSVSSTLDNPRLKQLVSQVDRLPSIPSLYMELVEELQDPEANLDEIARIISRDIAMTAKLLKLVNSAYFGLSRSISNTDEAIAYLGINTLKALVLTIHAFSQFEGLEKGSVFLDKLWAHSLRVAASARRISQLEHLSAAAVEEAFVAGMLHDIGQLVLTVNLRDQYDAIIQRARDLQSPIDVVESEILNATHAEVGGYLLGLWGLPVPVVEAITLHHQPGKSLITKFTALTAVHVAESLCQPVSGPEAAPPYLDPDSNYLNSLGLANRLSVWKHP